MKLGVLALGLLFSLLGPAAADQGGEEIAGPEVGLAVFVKGEVERSYRGVVKRLETGRAIRLYWKLTSHEDSELMMAFLPDRGVLLLGPETELYLEDRHVPDESRPLENCHRKLSCDDTCRLRLARGQRQICRLTVEIGDVLIEARGTDFALVAHPLYGLLVEVFEGALEVRAGGEVFSLSAGGLILVRGARTWLGAAAAQEAAPMLRDDATPFPDPPALTPEQLFSRGPDVGLPR